MRKNSLYLLIGFLAISFAFSSCLDNDNNNYELTSDVAISAFSIGDITMSSTIKTSDGTKDSTVYYTLSTYPYKFTIDQSRNQIYNVDSLPVGTDISKVAVDTLQLAYGYAVSYMKNGQDTIWNSADSIDFTKGVTFKAYALDGTTRSYSVKINVHKQDPDSLQWAHLENANLQIPSFAKHKAIYCNGVMYIYIQREGQALQVTSSVDGIAWSSPQNIDIQGSADYTSLVVLGDNIYITADGKVYTSTDGAHWTLVNIAEGLSSDSYANVDLLFAASPKTQQLYGLSGDAIIALSAATGLGEFSVTKIGSKDDNFPTQNLSYTYSSVKSNPSIERLTLIGTHDKAVKDTTALIWVKLSNEYSWSYYPQITDNAYVCPKLKSLATISYDGCLYAFGGEYDYTPDIPIKKPIQAFQYLYESLDGGISWHPRTAKVMFPKDFLDRNPEFSYLVDNDNFIWMFWTPSTQTGGRAEVWRGKINRLGFVRR